MRPSPYPHWLDDILAKSSANIGKEKGESLSYHTWLVLERLRFLIYLRPDLHKRLGKEKFWHLLYWSIFFHDFGKAHPIFQAVLRGSQEAKEQWGRHRHEVFSIAYLSWLQDVPREQLQWIISAIVSHHMDWDEIQVLYPSPDEDEEDPLVSYLAAIPEETILGLWKWVTECANTWIDVLQLGDYGVFALQIIPQEEAIPTIQEKGSSFIRSGLKSYRKFIDSLDNNLDEQSQNLAVCALTFRGVFINADHGGSAHVPALQSAKLSGYRKNIENHIKENRLFPHQLRSGDTEGSAILIAPTGSGKTEAALLWAMNQGNAPRLFYTLPFQASMNAMRIRLRDIFGEEIVGLQHGRVLLSLYRQLMEQNYTPNEAAKIAKRMKNLSELNHPPVRIFSPYQMLKAMYRFKGYEAQLTDYQGALFVFDEIHAYEINRLAMILEMIRFLRETFHARFFIMSATLPSLIRTWIEKTLGNPTFIVAEDSIYREFIRHQLSIIEGDLFSYIEQIADNARDGKSVLVVCNTVGRSQTVFERLEKKLKGTIPVELIHGRFNMRDRSRKEKFIADTSGTKSSARSPVVLVGTQVVEVSLDIDLDLLYSDPAPLEALVQRFGRINRGRQKDSLSTVHVFTMPKDGQKIYDPILISRTLQILLRENNRPINERMIGKWLDAIYSDEIAMKWEEEFVNKSKEFYDICIRTLRPFRTTPENFQFKFETLFDGVEVLPSALVEEYRNLKAKEPLLANELLVPIRWGQYQMLLKRGMVQSTDSPPIVSCAYDSRLGLTLQEKEVADEWD